MKIKKSVKKKGIIPVPSKIGGGSPHGKVAVLSGNEIIILSAFLKGSLSVSDLQQLAKQYKVLNF